MRPVPNEQGKDRAMDDTNLTPDEERQLREALAGAPGDLKDGFCRCWPAIRKLLEWLQPRFPPAGKIIVIGDAIFKILGCKEQ